MKSVSHCLFTGALLDTFFLGRIGVVAIYSYPHQGFNGSTVFLITMSVFDVIEINIIIIKHSSILTVGLQHISGAQLSGARLSGAQFA